MTTSFIALTAPQLRQRLAEHHHDCFAWAKHCCQHQHELAEDILQRVYLKILEGKAVFDGRSAFRTWVFSVIKHTATDEYRSLATQARIKGVLAQQQESVSTVEDLSQADRDFKHRFQLLLARLSAQQQEVLHLVFYQDLSIEASARVLDISLGSARTHYQRGKKRLAQLLNDNAMVDNHE